MKPFEHIENCKRVVNNLKFKLQYSKNKEKDAEDINTLIKALKSFDDMLVYKYKTDAINTLIYALFYELLMFYKAYENDLPLNEIIRTITTDLNYGSELKKEQVISILKTNELSNKIKNNNVFDDNYTNFEPLLEEIIMKIKTDIQWKK